MKKNSSILILTLIIYTSTYAIQAQTDKFDSEIDYFPMLSFKVETTKSKFLPSEPIPMILTLVNGMGRHLKGQIDLSFSSERVNIFVEKPDKTITEIKHISMVRGGGEVQQPILPNVMYQRKEILEYDLENYFSMAGKYKIWAVLCSNTCFNSPVSKVISNVITISITTPKGKDYEAYKVLKSYPDISRRYTKNTLEEYKQTLSEFVLNYGETPYGNYIAFELGYIYLSFKEYDKARKCLEKISPDFIFIEKVNESFKEIERKLQEAPKQDN